MEEFDHEVDAPRGATSREWEVFVREDTADPLTHVGSVSAPSVDIAREQAASLFARTAVTLWLCPADKTRRYQTDETTLGTGKTEDDATMSVDEMESETLRGENR
ncbi:unknown [Haloarcula marismortui ATCC 43049]|uniref:RSAM-partnered protein n=1 Tax=Haloarcula marismortui (strain ATCC 43049 / DSM 3752 / JCM 8966 / VKM B-1809) TaxID=272569 RepID=Q5V2F9_HALMA|nr:Htur_1727 family rSAM-partnered candidate RiPP [Haloarcula marismortui]AAV46293.1 unknown [Haloarcula marismortui ATCC 43049]QCP91033.1 rSAM-partnered protein [Haloarcula marismortui ATCC 43049]